MSDQEAVRVALEQSYQPNNSPQWRSGYLYAESVVRAALASPPPEQDEAVRLLHDRFCKFAGGGMCFRLECSTLDFIRAALATLPPVPAAPPLTDNQREAIAQQALIGPPVPAAPDDPNDMATPFGRGYNLGRHHAGAVPAAPPLDVERLAQAWEQHYLHNDSVHECSGNCSADLADEYARLKENDRG